MHIELLSICLNSNYTTQININFHTKVYDKIIPKFRETYRVSKPFSQSSPQLDSIACRFRNKKISNLLLYIGALKISNYAHQR